MNTTDSSTFLSDGVLAIVAIGYAVFNFAGVRLAAVGVIHPPWDILLFFTWLGPAILIVALMGVQFAAPRRFKWPAASAFLFAVGVAIAVNWYWLILASEAV